MGPFSTEHTRIQLHTIALEPKTASDQYSVLTATVEHSTWSFKGVTYPDCPYHRVHAARSILPLMRMAHSVLYFFFSVAHRLHDSQKEVNDLNQIFRVVDDVSQEDDCAETDMDPSGKNVSIFSRTLAWALILRSQYYTRGWKLRVWTWRMIVMIWSEQREAAQKNWTKEAPVIALLGCPECIPS